jgi:hypothetical protein
MSAHVQLGDVNTSYSGAGVLAATSEVDGDGEPLVLLAPTSDRDMAEVLEGAARLGARLILQTALEAEVTAFLGRERYDRDRAGSRNGHAPMTVKTAGPVTLFPVITGQTGVDPIFQGGGRLRPRADREPDARRHIQELIYRPTLHA